MVRKLLLILTFLLVHNTTFGQEEETKILFSEALSLHLPKYEIRAKKAFRLRHYDEAQFLFDSLVKFGLRGTYMDDFKFYRLNNKPVSIYDFKKPVYLITYASWCVTTNGEIPALNQLAEKYSDRIDFVILFWDNKKTVRKSSKAYNKHITVVHVDELNNKDAFVISRLKHSLGLPTTFLLDASKQILDIRRGVSHSYEKSLQESLDTNYNSIYDGIANHLLGGTNLQSNTEPVAVN
ncbi:hypothetical protein BH23BAC2_BH23BAC2_20460 [soil metagenome]